MILVIIFGVWTIIGAIFLGASIGESIAKHEHFGFSDIVGILLCVLMVGFAFVLSLVSMTLYPPDNMEYPAAEYQLSKKLLKTEVDGVETNVDTVYFVKKK